MAREPSVSAVFRTGQTFENKFINFQLNFRSLRSGAGHVIDNLLGKNTERMTKFKHDKLSTFGIGTELTEKQWKSVFRQLTSMGLLVVDMEKHGSIKLSSDYKTVLNGDNPIHLRHDPEVAKKGKVVEEQDKSSNKLDKPKSTVDKTKLSPLQQQKNKNYLPNLKLKGLNLQKLKIYLHILYSTILH